MPDTVRDFSLAAQLFLPAWRLVTKEVERHCFSLVQDIAEKIEFHNIQDVFLLNSTIMHQPI